MGTITIVENFTYVGGNGSSITLPWVSIPSELKQGELSIKIKSIIACALTVQGQTSFDSAVPIDVGSPAGPLTIVSNTLIQISGGLGPMLRCVLSSSGTTQCVISIYYTPKQS